MVANVNVILEGFQQCQIENNLSIRRRNTSEMGPQSLNLGSPRTACGLENSLQKTETLYQDKWWHCIYRTSDRASKGQFWDSEQLCLSRSVLEILFCLGGA